jgi:hypothetical protein
MPSPLAGFDIDGPGEINKIRKFEFRCMFNWIQCVGNINSTAIYKLCMQIRGDIG